MTYRAELTVEQFSPKGPVTVTMYGYGGTEEKALNSGREYVRRKRVTVRGGEFRIVYEKVVEVA